MRDLVYFLTDYSKLQSIRIGFSDIWETEFLTAYFGTIVTH